MPASTNAPLSKEETEKRIEALARFAALGVASLKRAAVMSDVPTIEFGHVETMGSAPGGYKGVGEGGAIGAPPAVVNAVADALARHGHGDASAHLQMPLTPSRVWTLLQTSS